MRGSLPLEARGFSRFEKAGLRGLQPPQSTSARLGLLFSASQRRDCYCFLREAQAPPTSHGFPAHLQRILGTTLEDDFL